jgi:hydrogenase maturation factor
MDGVMRGWDSCCVGYAGASLSGVTRCVHVTLLCWYVCAKEHVMLVHVGVVCECLYLHVHDFVYAT